MPYALKRPRLYYERHGAGEPLLLVTGFTISAAVFEPILPLYAERFDVVAYDHRGSGRSGKPLRFTSMAELAADAKRLMDALEIESAHVCGVSMGGMVAQELAIRFPERVRGLVLGATTPGGPRAVQPTLRELYTLAGGSLGALREPGRPWLSAALFTPEFRREHPERVRELLRGFRAHRAPPHGAWAHLLASAYHDTVSRLAQIQAPTLVMHGERDTMAPLENARLLARLIPDSELAIVPDAGHAYGLERPQETLRLVTEWLERKGPIAPGKPRTGLAARAEPLTRALGVPGGALRTGASLAARVAGRARRTQTEHTNDDSAGGSHVAVDRRAA